MNVAIMQPYFFPYMGYFNLLHSCDTFVFLDDVQFIRRGWINRNRIQQGDSVFYFTVPLQKAPRDTPIDKILRSDAQFEDFKAKFYKQLKAAYGPAPHFREVTSLVKDVLESGERGISRLAARSVFAVLEYLEINRDIRSASALPLEVAGKHLKGERRLIHISNSLGATRYINPPGGRELYSPDAFVAAGMRLGFLSPGLQEYDRPAPFTPGLSILDALMYLSLNEARGLIASYHVEDMRED